MKKTREYVICDRCKKEMEKINFGYDYKFRYELCDECYGYFKQYKEEKAELIQMINATEEKYKFGIYLPKNEGDDK